MFDGLLLSFFRFERRAAYKFDIVQLLNESQIMLMLSDCKEIIAIISGIIADALDISNI